MGKVLLAILFLVSFIGFVCGEERIEFQGRYWTTDLDTRIKVASNSVEGTDVDLKDDLGINDEDFPEARLTIALSKHNKMRFGYTQISYNGERNITRTIMFNGKSYTLGSKVETDFDLKYLRLGWIWEFINIGDGVFEGGTLFEVKGFIIEASLNAPSLSISESEDFRGAFPSLGLTLGMQPHKSVNLFAEASGISAGNYGYFYDAEVGVEFTITKSFTILGEYRILELKAEDDSNYAKLKIKGPFAGGTLRF